MKPVQTLGPQLEVPDGLAECDPNSGANMSQTPLTLSSFSTFGDVAAEDDAVLDYFVATKAVENVENHNVFLVLGRKGTGKTAIVRYLTEGEKAKTARSLSLRGYPWTVHAQRINHGASDIEAYVTSWRYLISVELSSLVVAHPDAWKSLHSKQLKQFLQDNYGGTNPQLSDILRPKRLTLGKMSLQPSIMGNQLGGIDLERSGKDFQFSLELDALTAAIMSAVYQVMRDTGSQALSLHFDELDQGLYQLEEARRLMLIGLILAARDIKRDTDKAGLSIDPVVYLRTDIWEEMDFSDKNKISQTQTLHLGWTPETLKALVEARLQSKLDPACTWDDIADPALMRGSQTKWNHIVARTFLRPRDAIKFLNVALDEAKKRKTEPTHFVNEDIVNSRDEYSRYLKFELDDEIKTHWPHWDEALQACSAIGATTFDRGEFEDAYESRRTDKNEVASDEALMLLHRFSVIGYERRSGYGGSSWSFMYSEPESGWDPSATRFKVHLGLKEFAKLREARQW